MICNDKELVATKERIGFFQQQVEKLRQIEKNPQNDAEKRKNRHLGQKLFIFQRLEESFIFSEFLGHQLNPVEIPYVFPERFIQRRFRFNLQLVIFDTIRMEGPVKFQYKIVGESVFNSVIGV